MKEKNQCVKQMMLAPNSCSSDVSANVMVYSCALLS